MPLGREGPGNLRRGGNGAGRIPEPPRSGSWGAPHGLSPPSAHQRPGPRPGPAGESRARAGEPPHGRPGCAACCVLRVGGAGGQGLTTPQKPEGGGAPCVCWSLSEVAEADGRSVGLGLEASFTRWGCGGHFADCWSRGSAGWDLPPGGQRIAGRVSLSQTGPLPFCLIMLRPQTRGTASPCSGHAAGQQGGGAAHCSCC